MLGVIKSLLQGRKNAITIEKNTNDSLYQAKSRDKQINPHLPSRQMASQQMNCTVRSHDEHYETPASCTKQRTAPIKDISQGNDSDEISVNRFIVDVAGISWDNIIGMDEVKEELQEVVALLRPDMETQKAIEHWNIEPLKGMLMYGPPGCGKTLIAKALAAQCGATFYLINGPEIKSKWVGESANTLRNVYRDAKKNQPSIVFIDEIDSMCMSRESSAISETTRDLVNALLPLLDGMKDVKNVFTIGATNRPELLDSALLRTGRLGKGIRIDLPDEQMRLAILGAKFAKMPLAENVCLQEIVDRTYGYSGADITGVVTDSARYAWRRNGHKPNGSITMKDIQKALEKGPTVSSETVAGYMRWEQYAFQ
jgi:transitional endoplasmic reticulum ATPase